MDGELLWTGILLNHALFFFFYTFLCGNNTGSFSLGGVGKQDEFWIIRHRSANWKRKTLKSDYCQAFYLTPTKCGSRLRIVDISATPGGNAHPSEGAICWTNAWPVRNTLHSETNGAAGAMCCTH